MIFTSCSLILDKIGLNVRKLPKLLCPQCLGYSFKTQNILNAFAEKLFFDISESLLP